MVRQMATCPVCSLSYLETYPPDVRRHRQQHDAALHGVRWTRLKRETMLVEDAGQRIICVTSFDTLALRRRAEAVARRAKRDTPYDFSAYHAIDTEGNPHVSIAIRDDRAIGFLVLAKLGRAGWVAWEEFERGGSVEMQPSPAWTVLMLWVHPSFQQQGIGRQLVTAAAAERRQDVTALA